ncbi:PadR family transcriptional regulator [Kineococcus sp. SYSU DK018]|uniref:PadR family transcriptional regulator n=1 Tax=Kineococcus sp. SYSU DK018 TaxID=3383139 RepID=UPI003D7C9F14
MAPADEGEALERRTQLLRGVLDMCLLALLSQRPCHAYELASRVQDAGLGETSYGTIYPLITRLRRLGLLEERSEPSSVGPPRKVFSVSADGSLALAAWKQQWQATTSAVAALLAGVDGATNTFTPAASHIHPTEVHR